MHQLSLPRAFLDKYEKHSRNNKTLMKRLVASRLFTICEDSSLPVVLDSSLPKAGSLSFFKIDKALFALDTNDQAQPLREAVYRGILSKKTFPNLYKILAIQKTNCTGWNSYEQKAGVPIIPWTMFEDWQNPILESTSPAPSTFCGFLSGKIRSHNKRRLWWEGAKNLSTIFITEKPLSPEEYVLFTRQVKWGITLAGGNLKPIKSHFNESLFCDSKNKREVEYASLGIPIALNYRPFYPKNLDFLFMQEPSDLHSLNTREKSRPSWNNWDLLFSPKASATLLLELL